jgi:hypothetical protein
VKEMMFLPAMKEEHQMYSRKKPLLLENEEAMSDV